MLKDFRTRSTSTRIFKYKSFAHGKIFVHENFPICSILILLNILLHLKQFILLIIIFYLNNHFSIALKFSICRNKSIHSNHQEYFEKLHASTNNFIKWMETKQQTRCNKQSSLYLYSCQTQIMVSTQHIHVQYNK